MRVAVEVVGDEAIDQASLEFKGETVSDMPAQAGGAKLT